MTKQLSALTKQQVYDQLYAQGKTLKTWCEEHGYEYSFVCAVANGRIKATRGKSREIAIKLGLIAA